MPLYEYQCKKCHRVFEIIQKFSDQELLECNDCGGEVERLLSAPAIQFKGSGWYITDYARKGSDSNNDGSSSNDGTSSKSTDEASSTESTTEKSDSSSTDSQVASGNK